MAVGEGRGVDAGVESRPLLTGQQRVSGVRRRHQPHEVFEEERILGDPLHGLDEQRLERQPTCLWEGLLGREEGGEALTRAAARLNRRERLLVIHDVLGV